MSAKGAPPSPYGGDVTVHRQKLIDAAVLRTKQGRDAAAGTAPTVEQFAVYQLMFDHFNRELFGGILPDVLLNFSRDAERAMGYYAAGRWRSAEQQLDEITLNPDHLKEGARETAQTLVHEMVHLWQQHFGKPSRTGYHNQEWAAMMESIGLVPSSTGQPGGKRVGQKMGDYPATGGPFEHSFEKLPRTLPWHSERAARSGSPRRYDKAKVKYTCPQCRAVNVWGRRQLAIICGDCGELLIHG